MLRHLRLARARGSLTAPNSPVQDLALEFLLALEESDSKQQRLDMVKGLVVQQGGYVDRVREQFPDYFDPFAKAETEEGEYDIDKVDDSQIEWAAPANLDDDEALSRWIAERERGSFTAAEMDL